MIGKTIKISKESERQFIIQDLNRLGVYEGKKGEALQSMQYFPLVHLLSINKAVRS